MQATSLHLKGHMHMVIPHNERTFILELADQGHTPEDIAAALVQRRALVEVTGVLHDHAGTLSMAETVQAQWHYVFLPPQRAGEDIRAVRVYLHDMAAFCSQYGLREKEMEKLAKGEIDEHRGWRQGPISLIWCPMVSRGMVLHQAEVAAAHTYTPATIRMVPFMPPTQLPATTYKP